MTDTPRATTGCTDPFHVIAMPSGPACNLGCEYCYYLEKASLYSGDVRMSESTLETFIAQYVEAHPGREVTFTWQGGEPTLRGLDFYRKAVELQAAYAPAETRVVNTIQTNGTRLNDEWCQFFAEHDFLVGISIDGPRDLHDRYRRTKAGGPTFEDVMDGLGLLQHHDVSYNVLCVLNRFNSRHPRRVYEFFKDQGVEWLQFIPLVEPATDDDATGIDVNPQSSATPGDGTDNRSIDPPVEEWVRERVRWPIDVDDDYPAVLSAARDAPVTSRSVDPAAYGTFMRTVFDEWVRNDVGEVSVRLFDQVFEIALAGEASLCIHRETCGDQVAMEHTGDVYACDHFVEPDFERGNVHEDHLGELVDSDAQRRFGAAKRDDLPTRCRECPVREFCHGGCPKDRHLRTPSGESGLHYLCAGYRTFFQSVKPYLDLAERVVAENKPLPFLMDEVTARDERPGA